MTNEDLSLPETIAQRLSELETRANNIQAVYNWIIDDSERSQHFQPDNFADGLEEALSVLMTQKQKERAEKLAKRTVSRGTKAEVSQAYSFLEKFEEATVFDDEIKKQIIELINSFKNDNNWGRIAAALTIFNRPQFSLVSKENNWLDLIQEQAEDFLSQTLNNRLSEAAQNLSLISEEDLAQFVLAEIKEKEVLVSYLKKIIFKLISDKRSTISSSPNTQIRQEHPAAQEENQEQDEEQILFEKAAEIAAAETIDLQDDELRQIITKIKALQNTYSRYAKVANEAALSMMSAFERDLTNQGRAIDNEKIRLQIEKAQTADEKVLLLTSAISRYDRAKQEEEKDFQDVNRSNPLETKFFKDKYTDAEFKELIENLPTFTSFSFLIKKLVSKHIIEDPVALNTLISQMQEIEGNNHKIESFVSRKANGSADWFQEATNAINTIVFNHDNFILSDSYSQLPQDQQEIMLASLENDIKSALASNFHSYIATMLVNLEISFEGIDIIASKVKEYDKKYITIDQILGIINSYPGFFEVTDSSYIAISKLLEKRIAQLRLSMKEGRNIDEAFINGFIKQIENIKDALDFGFLRNDILNYRCLGAKWTKDSEGAKIPQIVERMAKIISIGKKGLDAQGVNTEINEEEQTMGIGEYFDERLQWSDQMGILQQILCVMKQEMMKQSLGNGYLRPNKEDKKRYPDESQYSMEEIYGSQEKVNSLISDILDGKVDYTFYTGEPICCKKAKNAPFEPINIKKYLDEMHLGHEERAILMQEAMMLASARDFGGDATSFHMVNNLTASKLPPDITDPRIFDQPAVGAYYESRNNQQKILCNAFIDLDMEQGSFFNRTDFLTPQGRRDGEKLRDGKSLEKYGISAKTKIFWWWLYAQEPQLQKLQILVERKNAVKGVNSDFEYHFNPSQITMTNGETVRSFDEMCVCKSFDGRVLPPIAHFVSQRRREVFWADEAQPGKLKTFPPDAYLKLFAARDRLIERGELITRIDDVRSKFFDKSGQVKHDAVVQEISASNTDIAIIMGYLGSFSQKQLSYNKDVYDYLGSVSALRRSVDGADFTRYHEIFYHAYLSFLTALRIAVPGEIQINIFNQEKGVPANEEYKRRMISLDGAIRQGVSPTDTSGGLKKEYRTPIMSDFMRVDFRRHTGYVQTVNNLRLNTELIKLSEDPRFLTQIAKILPDYLEVPTSNGSLSALKTDHPRAKEWWEDDSHNLPPNPFAKKEEEKK